MNSLENVFARRAENVDRIWESIDRMNFPKHLKETALDLVGTSHALQSKLYPRWMSAKGQREEGWEKE